MRRPRLVALSRREAAHCRRRRHLIRRTTAHRLRARAATAPTSIAGHVRGTVARTVPDQASRRTILSYSTSPMLGEPPAEAAQQVGVGQQRVMDLPIDLIKVAVRTSSTPSTDPTGHHRAPHRPPSDPSCRNATGIRTDRVNSAGSVRDPTQATGTARRNTVLRGPLTSPRSLLSTESASAATIGAGGRQRADEGARVADAATPWRWSSRDVRRARLAAGCGCVPSSSRPSATAFRLDW